MSLGSNRSRLAALTRELSIQWSETRDSWTDDKAELFERKYLSALFAGVDRAVTALEELDEMVTKARKDCE